MSEFSANRHSAVQTDNSNNEHEAGDQLSWQAGNRVSFADLNSERSPNVNEKFEMRSNKSREEDLTLSIEKQAANLNENICRLDHLEKEVQPTLTCRSIDREISEKVVRVISGSS